MKTILKAFAILAASSSFTFAAEWVTDWEAAKAQAKKENKTILVNFTGTDWCGWCIRLDKEVFEKKAFQEYAKDNLVLLQVDYPKKKKQSAELKKQNKMLDEKFGITGYPTNFLLDAEGEKVSGKFGYREGGPEEYVKFLKGLMEKKS